MLAGTMGKHELVQQLADENAELTASFGQRSAAIEAIREREVDTKNHAELLENDLKSIERKLDVVGMTTAVGEILREQSVRLPSRRESTRAIDAVTEKITASSLRQIELEDERRQLRSSDRFIARLVTGQEADVVDQISDDLRELVGNRRALIGQAVELESTYAQALGDLDFTLHRYAEAIDRYRDFISERMLWIPSRDTSSVIRRGVLAKQLAETFSPTRWLAMLQAMPAELTRQPLSLVAFSLGLLLFYFTKRLVSLLQATGEKVGYVRTDLFANTLLALGITVVLSLRWPLLVWAVGWLFETVEADSELATAVHVALSGTALYFWGLEFLRLLLLPNGLAQSHFRWPPRRNTNVWRRIVRFEQTFLPAVFLVVFSISLYPREVGGAIGSIGVAAVLLSISHFFRLLPHFVQGKMDMLFSEDLMKNSNFWGKLIRWLLVWTPVLSIGAVFLGYTYTAMEFSLLLMDSVILYSVMLLLHELGLRWLRLTRRRMIVKVRHDMAQSVANDVEVSVEDEILEHDPELLNDEGTKLLNALLVITGLVVLAIIWSEVFPALRVLDTVELWTQTSVVDGRDTVIPVTLADLFSALVITIVGWVALSRIPSLLEILLRQKMNDSASLGLRRHQGIPVCCDHRVGCLGTGSTGRQLVTDPVGRGGPEYRHRFRTAGNRREFYQRPDYSV